MPTRSSNDHEHLGKLGLRYRGGVDAAADHHAAAGARPACGRGGQPGRNGDPGAADRSCRNRDAGTRCPCGWGVCCENAPSGARKRSPKAHPLSGNGAASSTVSAIRSAGGSPPRNKKGLSPGKGAAPRPEDADGLSDDDDDTWHDDESVDGGAETVTAHGTAMMMQCLYTELYGNPARSKAQMMATRESDRSPALAEVDAKRVETELLGCILHRWSVEVPRAIMLNRQRTMHIFFTAAGVWWRFICGLTF